MSWDADYRVSRAAAGRLCKNAASPAPIPSMSTTPPPAAPSTRAPFWRLSRRTWLLIAAAFAIGLLLFLLLWSGKREHDFFRATPTAAPGADGEFEPLPAPLPAGEDGRPAESARQAETAPEETPRLVEKAPAPAPAPAPTAPPPRPATAASASPTPIQMPAPRYPAQAARRGVGGIVRVRAEVGVDGVPVSVTVVEGSGTRELDRAALEAVRRWRFRPGVVDGRPVPGSVVVPIEFSMRH